MATKTKPKTYHAGFEATKKIGKKIERVKACTSPYVVGVYLALYHGRGNPPVTQATLSYANASKKIREHIQILRDNGWEVEDYRDVPIPEEVLQYI